MQRRIPLCFSAPSLRIPAAAPFLADSVRGLAERTVKSDLAIWPIGYKEAGDDLPSLYSRTEANRRVILLVWHSRPRLCGLQRRQDHVHVVRHDDRGVNLQLHAVVMHAVFQDQIPCRGREFPALVRDEGYKMGPVAFQDVRKITAIFVLARFHVAAPCTAGGGCATQTNYTN